MRLRVKYSEQEYPLPSVPENCSGKNLKDLVSTATGVEAHRIKLICMGKVIKDDKFIGTDYKLAEGALMHMVAREPEVTSAPTPPTSSSANTNGGSWTAPPQQQETAEGAAPAPADLSHVLGMLGGMFGGMGGAQGGMGGATPASSSGSGAQGVSAPAAAAAGGAGPAFANLFQNLGSMAANARANAGGASASAHGGGGGNATTSTSYTTTSPDGSRTQRTTSSTTSSTTSRTPPPGGASAAQPSTEQASPSPQPQADADAAPSATLPQQQHSAAASAAGIHVHIHVTLDELEGLPQKLEKFTQQVPYANVHLEQQPEGGAGAGQWFPRMRPAVERVVRNANSYAQNVGRGGGSVNNFFTRAGGSSSSADGATAPPTSTEAQHNARTAPNTSSIDEAEDVVIGESKQQPVWRASPVPPAEVKQPQCQVDENMDDDDDDEEESLLSSIGAEVKSALQMPDYMSLISGDWSSMSKVHPALHKRICSKCKSVNPTEEQLKNMTLKGCAKIRRRLEDPKHPLAVQLLESAKPGVNLPVAIEIALQHVGFQLSLLIVRTNPLQFAKQIRALVVKHTGVLYKYAKDNWFKSPSELDVMIKAGLTHALSSDAAQKDPTMAAMAPMMMPMVVNTIQMWTIEYERSGSYATDVPAVVTTPLSVAAGIDAAGDDLLDACLDEVAGGNSATGVQRQVEIAAALEEALAGMDSSEAAQLRKEIQRGGLVAPTNGATTTPATMSENYNALYKKVE